MPGPMSRRQSIWAVAATMVLIALIVGFAFFKIFEFKFKWPEFAITLLLIVLCATAFRVDPSLAGNWFSRESWRKPKRIMALVMHVLAFGGLEISFLSALAPSAIESRPGAIESLLKSIKSDTGAIRNDTAAIRRDLNQMTGKTPGKSRARQKIPGKWGEPGCSVTYDFAISENVLHVRSLQVIPGIPSVDEDGTIEFENHEKIVTSSNGKERGATSEFYYWTDGQHERLRWTNKAVPSTTELERCPT